MAGGTVVVNIIGNSAQLSTALSKAAGDLDGFAGKMQSAGQKMQSIGKNMTMGLTVPILGLGFVAFKAAEDFETAFTGVAKTVDATVPQLAALRQGIIDMSKEVPATTTEIAAVAEAAGQLGVKTDAILGFTRVMIDLGETTDLTADQAATALAQLANITQMPQEAFDRLGATVVDLGNKGASTESQIVEMGLRIAGAGHQIGLSEPQILGIGSALASVGIEAEAGGSAISRQMIDMASAVAEGGDALQRFATVAGVSASEFSDKFKTDASGALVDFIAGLQRIKAEGGDVLGTLANLGITEIRQRDAILRLAGAGSLLGDSITTANNAWANNNALQTEAEKRYATNAAKLQILKNELQDAARVLGEALMPIIKEVAEFVSRLATKFQQLSPEVQHVIVVVGLAVAALGPLVFVIGSLVSVLGAILSPVGLVILAIAAIGVAAYLLWTNWDTVWNYIKDHPAIAIVVSILAAPVAAFVLIIGALHWLYENWDSVWAGIQAVTAVVWGIIGPIFNGVVSALQFVWATAQTLWSIWQSIWSGIQSAASSAWGAISPVLGAIVGALSAVWGAAQTLWGIWTSVMGALGGIASGAAGAVVGALSGILGVLRSIIGLARDAADAIRSIPSKVGGLVPDVTPWDGLLPFADGGIVTKPTMALIGEAGPEAVIPLSQLRTSTGAGGVPAVGDQSDGRVSTLVIPVYLDGKVITEVTVANLNRKGGPKLLPHVISN